MKKIIIVAALMTSAYMPFADMLYFWVGNEELKYGDLTQEAGFTATITSGNGSKSTGSISVGQGNGYWHWDEVAQKYQYVTEPLTVRDFEINKDNIALGEGATVYSLYSSVSLAGDIEGTILLELDMLNGAAYTYEMLLSEMWDQRTWPYKKHYCQPIYMNQSEINTPEPSSGLLMLIGLCGLMLKRMKMK